MTAGEEPGRYLFHNRVIAHRFCTACGMNPYAEDWGEGTGRTAYINIRCLDAVDLKAVPVMEFDGRSAL